MADKNIHSSIIKQICKEILIPLGVFQKGTSRLYLDDNDYFFTVIEFQPSSWSNGTYLNIGLTFLWNNKPTDTLFFSFSRQPAARYGKFVEYKNETQFRKEITELVGTAKDEILFYRKLRDVKFAKEWMLDYIKRFEDETVAIYGLDIANICLLNNDNESAKHYYELYHHRGQSAEGRTSVEDLSKEQLIANIKATREIWHNKASMSKMPVAATYDRKQTSI